MHVSVSGKGCSLEIKAKAYTERLLNIRRGNNGQVGTGVTVIFFSMLEDSCIIPGCKQKFILLQNETQPLKRLDPASTARYNYMKEVHEFTLKPLHVDGLKYITGSQTT